MLFRLYQKFTMPNKWNISPVNSSLLVVKEDRPFTINSIKHSHMGALNLSKF